MKFSEYAKNVLVRRAQAGVRGITSERHRWRLHISTACFADQPIDEIRSKDIRTWLRDMAAKKAADTRGDRTLSPRSIKRSYALVSAIFTSAIEDELIESNPCNGVRVPKRADERETKEKWTYLTLDEQRALATCEAIPYVHRVAIRFAVGTGLRQGEQFNLPISDVHVDVPEPYVHVRFGSPNLPPKSGKTRKVPLFGDGLAAAREALELAKDYPQNPDRLVFPSANGKRRGVGKPLGRAKVNGKNVCAWKAALKLAGVRDHKWHGLRHTCATNLVTGVLGRRWTLEEIQPLMGHAAIAVTQIYAKVGDDALKRAARETHTAPLVEEPAGFWVATTRFVRRVCERLRRKSTETLATGRSDAATYEPETPAGREASSLLEAMHDSLPRADNATVTCSNCGASHNGDDETAGVCCHVAEDRPGDADKATEVCPSCNGRGSHVWTGPGTGEMASAGITSCGVCQGKGRVPRTSDAINATSENVRIMSGEEAPTCGWFDENDDGPTGDLCGEPATHYSCNVWGGKKHPSGLNACSKHKCRCAQPKTSAVEGQSQSAGAAAHPDSTGPTSGGSAEARSSFPVSADATPEPANCPWCHAMSTCPDHPRTETARGEAFKRGQSVEVRGTVVDVSETMVAVDAGVRFWVGKEHAVITDIKTYLTPVGGHCLTHGTRPEDDEPCWMCESDAEERARAVEKEPVRPTATAVGDAIKLANGESGVIVAEERWYVVRTKGYMDREYFCRTPASGATECGSVVEYGLSDPRRERDPTDWRNAIEEKLAATRISHDAAVQVSTRRYFQGGVDALEELLANKGARR